MVKFLVFEPNKAGRVVEGDFDTMKDIIGGLTVYAPLKHEIEGVSGLCVYLDDDGIAKNLKYNRGYFGTFIVVSDSMDGFESLTETDVDLVKKSLDRLKPFKSTHSRYLAKYFEEKDLSVDVFGYSIGMHYISLSNYEIIEIILNGLGNSSMLESIENTVREIDFRNADINHFLEHVGAQMANEMARNNPIG